MCPQTVPSKVPFLTSELQQNNSLFVGLSETWLNNHMKKELEIEGYTLFHCDTTRKKKSRGRHTGGVAIYVRDDIGCSCEVIFSHASECVQIVCLYSAIENLVILTLYRQPDDEYHGHPSKPIDFSIPLARAKNAISGLTPTPDIIMGGDFNLPHASWPEGTPTNGATIDEREMLNFLNELCNDLFMTQFVTESTHKDGNTLDLVFSNNSSLIHSCNIVPVLHSTTHHSIVQIETVYKVKCENNADSNCAPKTMFNALNFYSDDVDWNSLIEDLNQINWNELLNENDPNTMLDIFHNKVYEVCSKYVPQKSTMDRKRKSKIERLRRSLTKRRRKILKRLINVNSEIAKNKIKDELLDIEKKLQKSFRDSLAYMEEKAVKAIKVNSKYFFSYVRSKAKIKSKIGPLLNKDGKLTNNNQEMAEILSNQYTKVFSKPSNETNTENNQQNTNLKSFLSNIEIKEEDFREAITSLSTNAAAGPDGFPAILLKKCKENLAKPLTLLWRKSLSDGVVPDKLKTALITPIHKGDSKSIAANYRPIALTSHLIKLFEKVLRKHIILHMNSNNLFNDSQHGFRSGRSCLSQLLEHFDTVLSILDDEMNADVVYLDFAKAFDKVDHNIVLRKISNLGIRDNVFKWLKAFLTNRFQSVVVNGAISDPQPVISGVPQGSVLGPVIFLILIGDIDEDIVNSIVKSFADDTRVTKAVGSVEDTNLLQSDLDKIYEWSNINNMLLNDIKFELLRYGINLQLKNETNYQTPSKIQITTKNDVKDLGVIMSNTCLFKNQINKIIEKARNLIAWIFRTFKTRNHSAMTTLYKVLIIPVLEYCSVLWCPTSPGLIQMLEAIQWSFLRKFANGNDYWDCLLNMKIYSLERRRERYRIIYVWKILEGLVPNINDKVKATQSNRRGRHCSIPSINNTGKLDTIYRSSVAVHGAKLFNAMPRHIRDATSIPIEKFKKLLDSHLALVPDQPLLPGYTSRKQAISNSLLHMSQKTPSVVVSSQFQEPLNRRGEMQNLQS